ncbi:hypothetical protein LCGC14_2754180, partial [marine sediment metagenome]
AWNKGISSNGNQWILITIVNKFLKVFIEVCTFIGTIVGFYELWLVKSANAIVLANLLMLVFL